MNNIIKFLLIPIIMFGTNSSSCYSMENTNAIKNNNTKGNIGITYSDNSPASEGATFEQWTTRANFNPIDVNCKKYKDFNKFCEDHNLQPLRDSIIKFLVEIYNLAHFLINNTTIDNNINDSTTEWINQRAINDLQEHEFLSIFEEKQREKEFLSILEKQNAYYKLMHINNIKSIIRIAQEKLNPNKYSRNNTMNKKKSSSNNIINQDKYSDNNISDDISFDTNKSLNLVKCCYYFANQLVQLTHDIVYALNEKVKKYEETKMSNEEIYINFKNYLIDKIVSPCYKALDQAFLLLKEDDIILLKGGKKYDTTFVNILLNTIGHDYYDIEDFLHELNNYDINHIKYEFIYNISSLRIESLKKNNEFLNDLKSNTNEILDIIKDINNKFLEKLNKKLNISEIEKMIYQHTFFIPSAHIIAYIDDGEVTSNNDIINMANEDLIRSTLVTKTDILTDFYRIFDHDVISRIKYLNNNKEENEKFLVEYTKLSKAVNYLNYVGNNIDMHIPNKDYLSEIEELLKRIG